MNFLFVMIEEEEGRLELEGQVVEEVQHQCELLRLCGLRMMCDHHCVVVHAHCCSPELAVRLMFGHYCDCCDYCPCAVPPPAALDHDVGGVLPPISLLVLEGHYPLVRMWPSLPPRLDAAAESHS